MSARPSSTSASLLGRLRQSPPEPAAWGEFAHRYGPVLHQWCRQWRLQPADADDVTQTVLLRLVECLRDFEYDPALSFRAWLKTVTIHVWGKYVAARQRHVPGQGGNDPADLLNTVEARDDLAVRLEREYDRELLDLAMVRVAQRVQRHTWEAFRLLAIEGLTGAAVAERLTMNVATVYVARSKVQRMIQDELEQMDRMNP